VRHEQAEFRLRVIAFFFKAYIISPVAWRSPVLAFPSPKIGGHRLSQLRLDWQATAAR